MGDEPVQPYKVDGARLYPTSAPNVKPAKLPQVVPPDVPGATIASGVRIPRRSLPLSQPSIGCAVPTKNPPIGPR